MCGARAIPSNDHLESNGNADRGGPDSSLPRIDGETRDPENLSGGTTGIERSALPRIYTLRIRKCRVEAPVYSLSAVRDHETEERGLRSRTICSINTIQIQLVTQMINTIRV